MNLKHCLLGFLLLSQAAQAAPCYEADRLNNTKAALVHYFTNVDRHSCKNVAQSEIYIMHAIEKLNGRDLIQFFIKCDQEYPVIGKINWIESGCMASGTPAFFSSSELVK